MDKTITDEDLDATSMRIWQGLREDARDAEPDLSVDGLSEPFFQRLIRRLTVRRGA